MITNEELREIFILVSDLTDKKLDKCNHLSVENFSPELMFNLLQSYEKFKCGNPYWR
jgi:hypothetical protein